MVTYAKGLVRPPDITDRHLRSWDFFGKHLVRLPNVTAPTWDCRTLNLVNPIKDQKNCGSCWNFSGTCVVEGALLKAGDGAVGQLVLSEQYTMDCGQNGGCNGDDNSTVTEWAKQTGLPLSADYGPYQADSSSCKIGNKKLYKISDWGYCDKQDGIADTQLIKNAMAAFGPIGAAIAADDAFMNIRPGSVFQGSGSRDIDHDIVLIGWDDSKGAWLLRNSWSSSWVDDGYCWIKYGANQVGTSALWASAPTTSLNWLV